MSKHWVRAQDAHGTFDVPKDSPLAEGWRLVKPLDEHVGPWGRPAAALEKKSDSKPVDSEKSDSK
jgi:hypothetical protein